MGKGSGMRPGQNDKLYKENTPFGESPNIARAEARARESRFCAFSTCCYARMDAWHEDTERCPDCKENCGIEHDEC